MIIAYNDIWLNSLIYSLVEEDCSMNSKKPDNLVWHHATVNRQDRELRNQHRSAVLWFTGLSGAGKSTLAHAIEEKLYKLNCQTFVLDGDNVRHGLCSDLGFSAEDRQENIRRIGNCAKLFLEAGVVLLSAFISPFKQDRELVRNLVPYGDFIEIYCNSSLAVCEQRDIKGMYKKARDGVIKEFAGISSPYEEPENPDLIVNTGDDSLENCVDEVVDYLLLRGIINSNKT